ncbi:hypothetical protein K2X30_06185 [bacterium]|nr:hypothetical protein [bacterium]
MRQVLGKIHERLNADLPKIPFLNDKYAYYLVSKRVQRPADAYPHDLGVKFWSLKP